MALFHFEVKQISKKNKQGGSKSAAAVIAYRERTKIGKYNYSSRDDFVCSYSITPLEFADSEYAKLLDDPASFAAEIEKIEKRKDAQLFDEVEISLQHELTLDENIEVLNRFLQESYTVRGQFCRVAIHHKKPDNIHAHVLIPQRPLVKAPNGAVEFGKKLRDDFVRGRPKTADRLLLMRSTWASIVNDAFVKKGLNLTITHESLKTQHENALAAGDLVKAAETDRPALYLPKSSRRAVTEVIVDSNGDYDFESNKQHFANVMKAKDLESLTIDVWLRAVQFWQNAHKIKTNFRLARRKQRQKIQSIIKENLQNAIRYATEITQRRITAISPTMSAIAVSIRSSLNHNQNAIIASARLANLLQAESNKRSSAIEHHRSDYNASGIRKTIQENSGSYGSVLNVSPTAYASRPIRISNQSGSGTSYPANTDYDKLAKELDQALLAKFKQAPSSPRHRI